ncbi:MAG TPA: hypothetical protein VMB50_19690 [Myxococcales bacterium]|nr:hypothetical protein [Myxococcales bacterium]
MGGVAKAQAAQASGLRVEAQESERLSDKEKLSRSDDAVTQMQKILREVLDRLEEARKERDLVKLNCINEKLTQVKALLRIAEQSYVGLQEAVARAANDNAEHEFAKIEIARQRVAELRAEAEQCIGQLAYVVDEKTVVTVETPEGLPDATTNPPAAEPVVVNPPVLSPLQ